MEIESTNNTNTNSAVFNVDPFVQPQKRSSDDMDEEKQVVKQKREIVIKDDDEVDEIENIIESKKEGDVTKYLIKWVGKKNLTWITEDDFVEDDLLNDFKEHEKNRKDVDLPKRAYIYCRTSKRNSDREVSLVDQEEYCLKFAKELEINVIGVFRDNGISAKNMDNQRSLNYICNNIKKGECVLFYDVTRFSRDIVKAISCLEKLRLVKGALAHACHDGVTWNHIATSRNTFRLHLSNAQLHSEVISEKVKSSIAFRRERGDHIGPAPYGQQTEYVDKCRKLVVNKKEQKVIALITKEGDGMVAGKLSNLTIRKKGNTTPKDSGVKKGKGKGTGRGRPGSKKHTLTPVEYRKIAATVNKTYKDRKNKPFTWQAIRKIHG